MKTQYWLLTISAFSLFLLANFAGDDNRLIGDNGATEKK
jgi:hypothetical protein